MKIFKNFVNVVLCILLICFLSVDIFIFCVSDFAKTENIQKNFASLDLAKEVNKIKNSGGNSSFLSSKIDEMYELSARLSIPSSFVDRIISSSAFKEALGGMVGSITDYVINGVSNPLLTEDEIYKIIDDNIDAWTANEEDMSDTTKRRLVNGMKEIVPSIVASMPTSVELAESNYKNEVNTIQFIFSGSVKAFAVCFTLLICLVLVLINLKNFNWTSVFGFAFFVTSLFILVLGLFLPDILAGFINTSDVSSFVGTVMNFLEKPFIYSSICLFVLSLILFVLKKFLYKEKA